MNIKKDSRENTGSEEKTLMIHPGGYIVREEEMRHFMEGMMPEEIQAFAAAMQAVADATRQQVEGKLRQEDMKVMKKAMAFNEDTRGGRKEGYERIKKNMLEGVKGGERGIRAVNRTAWHVTRLAFYRTSEYEQMLMWYQQKLRQAWAKMQSEQ